MPIPTKLTLHLTEALWQQKNREVRMAKDQVLGAQADTLGAAQSPNAQLTFSSNALDTGSSAPAFGHRTLSQADVVVRVDQLLERGDKRGLRMRGADLRLDASRQDLANAYRQGRIVLYQAYYDLHLAQEKLRIAQENAELFAQSLAANQLRVTAGDLAPAEFSRMRVDALRAENDQRQALSDLHKAQITLAYQVGAETSAAQLEAIDPWPALQEISKSPDLDKRPDVQAARKRVEAAYAARDLAQALNKRDVTLSFQVERNGSNVPLHSVGLGVSIPLHNGYEYQGEIAHAEADLQAARDALEQTRAQALTEMKSAQDNLEAAVARLQNFDGALLQEATRALQAAEFAYRQGILSLTDLLDARRTHKAVQLDAATAHADYAKALAAWQLASIHAAQP